MSRVLIFSPSVFQPFGHNYDYVMGLAKGAARDLKGMDIHVLGYAGSYAAAMSAWVTTHTLEIGDVQRAKGASALGQVRWGLQRIRQSSRLVVRALQLAERLNIEGVFFETFEYYTLAGKIARFRQQVRCIFHDTNFGRSQTSLPARIYKTGMARSAVRIVGQSQRVFVHGSAMKENLVSGLGLGTALAARIIPIPYGAPDPGEFRQVGRAEARRALGIAFQGPLLLVFGTLRRDKEYRLLLAALALTRNWRLLIAGPEGDITFAELEAAAVEMGVVDRIFQRNQYITNDGQPEFFAAADAVAGIYSPAIRHESGTCQLARAFVKPVVVSGPPDLKAYVRDNQVGWIADEHTSKSLAAVLEQIEMATLAEQQAMRKRIVECAVRRSWPRVAAAVFQGWYQKDEQWPATAGHAETERALPEIGPVAVPGFVPHPQESSCPAPNSF